MMHDRGMTDHFCQAEPTHCGMEGRYSVFSVTADAERGCGKPAHFYIVDGDWSLQNCKTTWLCAEHYDMYIEHRDYVGV
jgi:hypothetical protein